MGVSSVDTITVYRIEHRETGIGPYHSSQTRKGLRQWNQEYETMPPPWIDGIGTVKNHHRFAHPSIEVIQSHYRKRILKWLHKHGYVLTVYTVSKGYKHGESGKQVCYHVKHAVKIDELPLMEIVND